MSQPIPPHPSPPPQGGREQSLPAAQLHARTRWLLGGLCFIVAVTTLLGWCFRDRNLKGDELGLFNPTFMAYSTGQVTYPMHGQWNYMTVHPPFLYWVVGMLMRPGLSPVQAAGLHCWILLVAILVLLMSSRLELRLKLCIPPALLMTISFFGQLTLRPEVPILLSWLAGIVALENSRSTAWRRQPLFWGGLLLAYASGLHYWSFLVCLSCLPYFVAMLRDIGVRRTVPGMLALLGGATIFAAPFLLCFLLPLWPQIMDNVASHSSTGSVAGSYAAHLSVIGQFPEFVPGSWLMPSSVLFQPVYVLRVIPICLALVILITFRGMRVMLVASLPLPLFVAFCIQRKMGPWYLLPELYLWFLSLLLVGHALLGRMINLAARFKRPALGTAVASVAVCAYALLLGAREVSTYDLSLRADLHTVARAASRQVLPADNLLGLTSMTRWYTGGGTDLCLCTVWGQTWEEFAGVLPKQGSTLMFADDWLANQRRAVPFPYWYLDGHVHLTGFTLGSHDFVSVFVSQEPKPVRGFWLSKDHTLRSFQEDPAGDHVFVALRTERAHQVPDGHGLTLIRLENPAQSSLVLCVTLYSLEDYRRHEATLRQLGTIRDAVRGTLHVVDRTALLAEYHRTERPIRFHRTLAEAAATVISMDAASSGQTITLRPLLDRPEVRTSADGTGYDLRTNHSQDDWQMEADLTVTPNTLYRFQFDLTIHQGGLFVHVFDPSGQRYMYSFSRPDPQSRKTECFLFNSGPATHIRFGVANNRPNGRPGRSQATIDNIQFMAVP